MHLASLARIKKFNCQKLYLKRVEIVSINSSVRVGTVDDSEYLRGNRAIETDWTSHTKGSQICQIQCL